MTKKELLSKTEQEIKVEFLSLKKLSDYCNNCYNCNNCNNCNNCDYCDYCYNCDYCYKQTSQQYMVLNIQLTEEEYKLYKEKQ